MNKWQWELLERGAQMSPKLAADLGQAAGAARGPLLATLVNQGKLKPQDLSPQDTQAAASNLDKAHGGESRGGFVGSALGGVGGFFGNLGSDIYTATKGLGPGIANAGTSVVNDAAGLAERVSGNPHGFGASQLSKHDAPSSQINENIIQPQLDYYKQQYGQGNVFENFYNHPLGPILDAATLASLGAGGAGKIGTGLERAGKISSENPLARISKTDGRAPLEYNPSNLTPEEAVTPEISRLYSTRPLRKGMQIATDKVASLPTGKYENPVLGAQKWQARTFSQKMGAARRDSEGLQHVNRQVSPQIPELKALGPEELQAFDAIVRLGGNDISHNIDRWQGAVAGSILNELPDGANASNYGKIIDPKLAMSRFENLGDPVVKALAEHPEHSEKLMSALHSWYGVAAPRLLEDLPEEAATAKTHELLTGLDELRHQPGEEVAPQGTPPLHPSDPVVDDLFKQASAYWESKQTPRTAQRPVESLFNRGEGPSVNADELPVTPPEDMSKFDWRTLGKHQRDEGIYTEDLQLGQRGPESTNVASTPESAVDPHIENTPPKTEEEYRASIQGELDHIGKLQGELDALLKDAPPDLFDTGEGRTDHPFPNPTIAPVQLAKGFEYHEPTRLGEIFGSEEGFKKHTGQFSPSNVTYQNVFQEPFNSFKPNANPLLAGVHRPDARSYVDLIAKHERDMVNQAYSSKLLDKWALKNQEGEFVTVKSDAEAQQRFGPQYAAVHPTAPLHYYNDQTTVADMASYMEQNGFPVDGPEMQAAIKSIGEDTVIKMTSAAQRQDAFVVPRNVAEYQRKIENASKPYENKALRMLVKPMNLWRQYTLSLMPRWALNTAVGSFMLNTIKGVGPKDYHIASKLREGSAEHPNVFESPQMGGVELGNVIGMEMQELASQAGMGTNRAAQWSMRKVQSIEDYFRRASMVHSMSKEAKQGLRENGNIISGFESSRGPRSVDEYRDLIEQDPQLVRRALDDVDKFAYNFAALGPFERRAVRQIAPFWGWYRFISGVAYKLPIEYPGRTNVLASIGRIGMADNDAKYGEMPTWLKSGVLMGAPGKAINYLGTSGLNPLSQVFNPGSPEGFMPGIAQLGQASPLIQSVMAGFGIDPQSGRELDVSPEHGVSPDSSGQLRDEKTGEEKNPAAVAGLQRGFASLIRAFPEARIGEKIRSGGRTPYPESIPLLAEYYRASDPQNRYGGALEDALAQMLGISIRPFDLPKYQSQRNKGQRSSIRKGARSRARIKRSNEK